MTLYEQLVSVDSEAFEVAWGRLFFNLDVVKQLLNDLDNEKAARLLEAGSQWRGRGYTTSKAAKLLFQATGVSLVSSEFHEYRDAFLFALSLILNLEVPRATLPEAGAQAAFAWASCLQEPEEQMNVEQANASDEEEKEQTKADGLPALPWETEQVDLPPILQKIWQSVQEGKRLEMTSVLKDMPSFKGLPVRAPENNSLREAKGQMDKVHKSWETTALQVARMLGCLYDGVAHLEEGDEMRTLFLQTFHLVLELELRIKQFRKMKSMPGCVAKGTEQLFGKDDLAQVQLNKKIAYQMGTGRRWGKSGFMGYKNSGYGG